VATSRLAQKLAQPGGRRCVTIGRMSRSRHRRKRQPRIHRRAAPGTKPGTLNISPEAIPSTIDVIAYDQGRIIERQNISPKELKRFVTEWSVTWVNVVGLGTENALLTIAETFNIHPLAMEDVVNVHQRAKVDPFETNVYCVFRMPDPVHDQLTEQLSLFLGKNFVLTFQEGPGDCFDLVRGRLRQEHSVMRQETKADYLAYRLIDAAVDAYFPILENIGDRLDDLDDRATVGGGPTAFSDLHTLKRELLLLRRALWPLRDAVSALRAEETMFISDQTRVYLRDCYDHMVQLIDLVEAYRDICADLRDYYLSSISNRMNEVMKTLTIIATIFIPLSFIAGLYGMNFDTSSPWNMPELGWRWGYPAALAVMAAVAGGMLLFFKRRGWIGKQSGGAPDRPNGSETGHR
jgi:magnesium transporter